MGQQNYFLLDQQCFKAVGPALAHYWHANPPFANGFHNLPTMAQLSVLLGLELIVKRLNVNLFNGHDWIFQLENAPAHNVKTPSGG